MIGAKKGKRKRILRRRLDYDALLHPTPRVTRADIGRIISAVAIPLPSGTARIEKNLPLLAGFPSLSVSMDRKEALLRLLDVAVRRWLWEESLKTLPITLASAKYLPNSKDWEFPGRHKLKNVRRFTRWKSVHPNWLRA